jgi:hypothetical protein
VFEYLGVHNQRKIEISSIGLDLGVHNQRKIEMESIGLREDVHLLILPWAR